MNPSRKVTGDGSGSVPYSMFPVPWLAARSRSRLGFCSLSLLLLLLLSGLPARAQSGPLVCPIPGVIPGILCAADIDGDGLCDSWELNGGVDLNGDGRIDSTHDLKLSDANRFRQDVYLEYDYMVLPDQGTACTPTLDPSLNLLGNPLFSTDCNTGQACIKNVCRGHTHAPDQKAVKMLVDAYAAHGINLRIEPKHEALPHHTVVTFTSPIETTCAGTDAVNFFDLKAAHFDPKRKSAYHYALFGHYNTCDGTAICGPDQPNCCSNCQASSDNTSQGSGGFAEKPGNDLIVSQGFTFDVGFTPTILDDAAVFMHELGHNLGLDHAGPLFLGTIANDVPQYKPNYLSVMNPLFVHSGIPTAAMPGSTVPVSFRVDYSNAALPTLNEALSLGGLNENLGIQAGTNDITVYFCADFTPRLGAGTGPIDWNCNENPTDSNVEVDINANSLLEVLTGARDWGNMNFAFQCAAGFGNAPPPPKNLSQNEPSILDAFRRHLLFSPRAVGIEIRPGCSASSKPLAPGQAGEVTVALLGADDLDLSQVDLASLKFAGASPLRLSAGDSNGDGKPDLTVVFDMSKLKLPPNTQAAHQTAQLTGWLRNSQLLVGEGPVTVVPNMASQAASCRN